MLRPLKGFEKFWASDNAPEYLEFAVKFDDPKLVPIALENFKKLFCGTRLKIVNECYHKADPFPITKIPNYIQDCEEAVTWMISNNVKPCSQIMTTFSINDTIIAGSTCHNTGSGGYVFNAVRHCLDNPNTLFPDGKQVEIPCHTSEMYGDLIEKAIKSNPPIIHSSELSEFSLDLKSPYLMPKGSHAIYLRGTIPASSLQCYDKVKKRPINLSNQVWTAFSLVHEAYGAKQQGRTSISRLSTSSVVDLDRMNFSRNKKINWNSTNSVCSPNIYVDTTPDMTIEEIGIGFRKNHDLNENNGAILWFTQGDTEFKPAGKCGNGVSNIGPIVMKNGLKDFYLQSYSPAPVIETSLFFSTFSVVTKHRNDVKICLRYQPTSITAKTARIIKESTEFVLTQIPLKTRLKDAVKELQDFQTMLEEEY